MADVVTTQVLQDGDRVAVLKFTNKSDGTGEAAVSKITPANLQVHSSSKKACDRVAIESITYATVGMSVDLLWDATADVLAWSLPADESGYCCFKEIGPLVNPEAAGSTGIVQLTTTGHTAGDSYVIIVVVRKTYS